MDEITDEEPPRTFSIWWFLALFLVMIGFGIYGVIAWGTYAREPTDELPRTPVTTDPGATTTSSSVPVTLVDGSAAQPGIIEVQGAAGDRIYRFEIPEAFSGVATASEVPRVEVERGDDDRTLTLTLHCAVSAEAVPSMLHITEDPFEVNLTPVVVAPRLGEPCPDDGEVATVKVVLDEPVGARRLVIERPGTKLDDP